MWPAVLWGSWAEPFTCLPCCLSQSHHTRTTPLALAGEKEDVSLHLHLCFFYPNSVPVTVGLMPSKMLQCNGGGRYLGTEFEDGDIKLNVLQDQDYIKTLFC